MASLIRPGLVLRFDHERQTVVVVVLCTIRFSELERCLMKSCPGKWFTVGAAIWGQDDPPGRRGDRRLFRFRPAQSFGATVPEASLEVRFVDELGWTALDEDRDDVDEIYAEVTLRNHLTEGLLRRRTGTINWIDFPNVEPSEVGSGVGVDIDTYLQQLNH
jgi:hypothetical protein